MSTIRETAMIDPISSEELDIDGNIHRYNFGWMVTRTIVGLEDDASPSGTITESTTTGISGNTNTFHEVVTQEILPPSLDLPEGVATTTEMQASITVGTYYRYGTKKRVYTKAKVFGTSEIVVMGESPFSISEEKEYADAIGPGSPAPAHGGGGEVVHADGGAQYTIANGVKTKTDIKG